jgi:hypothetical protein
VADGTVARGAAGEVVGVARGVVDERVDVPRAHGRREHAGGPAVPVLGMPALAVQDDPGFGESVATSRATSRRDKARRDVLLRWGSA